MAKPIPRLTPVELHRLFAKLDRSGPCWIWTGAVKSNGYGNVKLKRDGRWRTYLVHRVVYRELVGEIPDGLELDHVKAVGCTSLLCCNPRHLEPVTGRENTRRTESPTAQNVRKTHCPRGHPYDMRNGGRKNGRWCRTCKRVGVRASHRRRQEQNPEKVLAYRRQYYEQNREKNREKALEATRRWRARKKAQGQLS